MRLAVLLFGHLRDFETCASSLNDNLLTRYDCDLFMHTWDETEPSTLSWHKDRTQKRKVDHEIVEKLYSLYPIKKLKVEHQEKYQEETIVESNCCQGIKCSNAGLHFMFDTMRKANLLRKEYEEEHETKYDYVVVTRPDVKLKTSLDISRIINQSQIVGLPLDRCRFFASLPITSSYGAALYLNEPNDLLFFAKPEVIDRYIEANSNISNEYIKNHLVNIVSVYTSKELAMGILPIAVSYSMGYDWSFSRARIKNKRGFSLKNLMAKIAVFITRPVFYFYQKHEWLNYYN